MASISEEEALALAAQFEADERLSTVAAVALDSFIKSGGEDVAPYFTSKVSGTNISLMARWGIANLPYGKNSFETSGVWTIAFRNTKDSLVRDSDWLSAEGTRDLFIKLYNSLSSAQVRNVMENRDAALVLEQQNDLARIGGAEKFRALYQQFAK